MACFLSQQGNLSVISDSWKACGMHINFGWQNFKPAWHATHAHQRIFISFQSTAIYILSVHSNCLHAFTCPPGQVDSCCLSSSRHRYGHSQNRHGTRFFSNEAHTSCNNLGMANYGFHTSQTLEVRVQQSTGVGTKFMCKSNSNMGSQFEHMYGAAGHPCSALLYSCICELLDRKGFRHDSPVLVPERGIGKTWTLYSSAHK